MIIFYVLCLLYVLSTATVVCDLLNTLIASDVSNNSLCNLKNAVSLSVLQDALSLQLQIDIESMYYHLLFVRKTVTGCCDVIAQFILVRINIVIRFIHLNVRRSTGAGSCGVKISVSSLSLHFWQSLS